MQRIHRRRGRRGSRNPDPALFPRRLLIACGALALAALVATLAWPGAPYRVTTGDGHGRGLSQHGAFESAQDGWNAERILAHYYPGAELGRIAPTLLRVRLQTQDDSSLDTYADAGAIVAGRALEPGQVAHLTALPDGGANVLVTLGCDGEVVWQGATDDPWVYPIDLGPNRPPAEHLRLCGGTGYRGALGVALEDGAARTVNEVDVEDYLLGVVPTEMQANWADKGAGEALRAQAVAARSYALAEQRYDYAQTCDSTDCQMYPGTEREDPRAAVAVASTAGTVLLRDGHLLRSEYSAAPDGGEPADIDTFEIGPLPADLPPNPYLRPDPVPQDPRVDTAIDGPTAIQVEYQRIGGEQSAVGAPVGPELDLPLGAGTYQLFANGVIIATETLGAQVVDFDTLLSMIPENP
ncbi:SpoIID/LytB domain-containing protein [Nocardia harenae]|uniref:SpoIID/LytB domain-containing protein n=1 Tax=Nocardia harenae TaxID=358707 RepID=UPI000AA0C20D|nr:SpoIID/LytB domain-containing protein [Nocardia harenae]